MTTPTEARKPDIQKDAYEFGFHDSDTAALKLPKGLSRETVNTISDIKNEPLWMRELRLKALEHFQERPLPDWGGALDEIDFDDIHYFVRASDERDEDSWDDVPQYIRDTYDKLGIPEAEKKGLLAGVGAQYDSEVVYHNIREDLAKQGVDFPGDGPGAGGARGDLSGSTSGRLSPSGDNKYAALNSAVWSGGSFIYDAQGCEAGCAAAGVLPDQHGEHGAV